MAVTRKSKEAMPVLAICYDFDKTLSPDDMQAQGYIQAVYDGEIPSFWRETNEMAEAHEMDSNLAYMYKMIQKARGKILLTRKSLEEYGSKVKLFAGVEEWFERIREYGKAHHVIVEHYIISCGLKEMIEGTSVAKAGAFEKIYASSFMFDETGVPIWPAQAINYTSKTQFLFRIEKGILDINDSGVNDYFSPEELRVPFRNMVYIGDSDTDVPCMKLVNTYGGYSIGVFDSNTLNKTKVYKMLQDNRIKFFVPADYRENSELDKLIKSIIDRTEANEVLENIHLECKKEQKKDLQENSGKQKKLASILSLSGSRSFSTVHAVIKKLSAFKEWEQDEIIMLLEIAVRNKQVYSILNDADVGKFYRSLLEKLETPNENARKIQEILEKRTCGVYSKT